MYDMNFELLTMLYYYFKRHKSYDHLDEFILALSTLYKNEKFFGEIVNLFFKDDKEMKEQLDIDDCELKDISTIFKNSIQLLENMKTLEIIPDDINFIYGIEGLNHIENEDKLVELYNLGLRAISNSCLNNYEELTDENLKIIKKAMELGIVITINKTPYKSLKRVINLIDENKDNEPIVIFNEDNIEDLRDLPSVPYYILVTQNKSEATKEDKEISFIKRIRRIKDDDFFQKNNIILCKSNREFCPKKELPILLKSENDSIYLRKKLTSEFGVQFTNKIMKENASIIFDKVLENESKKQKKYIA